MINDEVEVGPILGGLLQVERPARLLVERPQRQPFVDARFLMPSAFVFSQNG